MEKSVSRADLLDEVPSSPESLDIDVRPQQFDFVELEQHHVAEVEEEVTFRLFAPSKTENVKEIQTIRLRSPTPDVKEAGFVVPKRDTSYYFTDGKPLAAVSSEDVQRLAGIKWTGMSYDWKVLKLSASQVSRSAKHSLRQWPLEVETPSRRRRLGKKARIKLRMTLSAARTKAKESQAAKEAQDVADREKKARRNREKKVKQRQRIKAKKAAGAEQQDDGDEST